MTSQSTSSDERKLSSSFESVKRLLAQQELSDRLDKPLAYWALPNDRRLPLAFLGRSIQDLISTPFDELLHTRGVGQKKISSLVRLLNRACNSEMPETPFGIPDLTDECTAPKLASGGNETREFDPSAVSELLWATWCGTVKRFGLERELLGRLAPSLEPLPTVIWQTPIREYATRTLAQIRSLKTHGEKRVRVILEVFHAIDETLREVGDTGRFGLRLIPRFVAQLEARITDAVARQQIVTREWLDEFILEPLLAQVRLDSGEMIYTLTRQRLGHGTPQRSVRDQAHELGVTRARVYQMLEDCGKIMAVRWPEGRQFLGELNAMADPAAASTLRLLGQLFYPGPDTAVEKELPGEGASVEEDGLPIVPRLYAESTIS